MIRTYSELSDRQKEEVAARFLTFHRELGEFAYEVTQNGSVICRTRNTKINIFGQLKDGGLRLLLQDIPVRASEAGAEGTRIALSMRSDPEIVEAWWDFAENGYTPQERGIHK